MSGGRWVSRGAFSIEYAVLFAIVGAAVLGMAVYTLRAINGKWRDVGDQFGQGRQYEHCVTKITINGTPTRPADCPP